MNDEGRLSPAPPQGTRSVPPGAAVATRVRVALAGVVRLQEALEVRDRRHAYAIAANVELDLRELAYLLERQDSAELEDAA